jgi:hypothetical protein
MRSRYVKLFVANLCLFASLFSFQNCSNQMKSSTADSTQSAESIIIENPVITFINGPEFIVNSDVTIQFTIAVPNSQTLGTVRCSLGNNAPQNCSTGLVTYSSLQDGIYSIRVNAETLQGGRSEQTYVFRKDTTAPVVTVSSSPSSVSNLTSGIFTFMTSDNLSGIRINECSLNNAAFTSCTSPVNVSNLATGSQNFRIRSIDRAGNTSSIYSYSWVVNLTAPTVTISTAPSSFTNSTNSSITFSGINIVSYQCQINNGTYSNCSSPHSLSNLTANAAHVFRVRGTNSTGVVSAVAEARWTIDTIVPSAPLLTPNISAITQSRSASISFSSTDALAGIALFECSVNSGAFAACTNPRSFSNLSDGQQNFSVRAVDNAGNTSQVGSFAWRVDATAPALAFSQTPQASTTATTASFSFASSDAGSGMASVQCSLDAAAFANCTSPVSLTGLSIAAHQYRVRATDLAGNQVTITHNWTVTQVTTPSPVGAIVPAMQLEFVDATGTRQLINAVDGQTQITGVAPFLVQMDASGTRAPAAFAAQSAITDAEAYAFLNVGYRINFGETLSGSWRYPEGSSFTLNEETGPPLFSRIYRTAGAYSARLKVRDTLGNEVTLRFTVNVTAAPAATHIAVSAGSWPDFQSNRRYTLQAGGDYRSFGTIETGGLHNISFEKTGTGTDPRIATFSPDGRSKFSATQMFEARASHIRLVNIDINEFSEGQRGFNYVGVVGGLVRIYGGGAQAYAWHEGSEIIKSNCRYSRGLFFENTEVYSTAAGGGFVMFGTLHGFHTRGTRFVHKENGPSTYLMLRLYGRMFSLRNNYWFSEVDGGGANGTLTGLLAVNGATETVWRNDDLVGPLSATQNSQTYGYISDKMFAQNNQFHGPGSFLTNAVHSTGGGNPYGTSLVRPRLIGHEDNVYHPLTNIGRLSDTGELYGQHNFWRNNRKDMGRGAYITAVTGAPNRNVGDNTTFEGPYHISDANPRPTPTGF